MRTLIGKAAVGLFVLVALFGIAARLLEGDDPAPSPVSTEVAVNIDPPASRTPPLPTKTAQPLQPTATPSSVPTEVPATATEPRATLPPPTATPTVEPTHTERSQPTRTVKPTRISISPTPIAMQRPVGASQAIEPTVRRPPTTTPEPPPPTATQPPPTFTAVPPTETPPPPTPTISGLALAATDCSGYDAWEWAQSVYETDPATFAGLDPDGNGIACDGLGNGFAPAFWVTGLPQNVVPGTVDFIVDGDTYEIVVNGQSARYRLYHADTPETHDPVQCGGSSATDFVQYILSFNDTPGQVWIETVDQRDKFGRKLAYVWFTVAGEPYLLNHILINNGWAEDIDYGDDFNPYKAQLSTAARFAQSHRLGVWAQCGGFGKVLPDPTPIPTQPLPPTSEPFVAPTQAPMGLGSGCVPSYSPCVPSGYSDLDCPDIGFRVQVNGADPYRLDADHDGVGCESY